MARKKHKRKSKGRRHYGRRSRYAKMHHIGARRRKRRGRKAKRHVIIRTITKIKYRTRKRRAKRRRRGMRGIGRTILGL